MLKEGKASLTTSFQAFKFIELYSFIQFFTSILCYIKGAAITDGQFLYIDLVALVPLAIFQAWTGAYHKLTKDMPTDTLFYKPVLISVFVSAAIQLGFQIFYFLNVQQQPFYVPPFNNGGDDIKTINVVSYESTVLFYIANFQYLMTCLSFSIAKPFRRQVWTNLPFFISIISIFIFDSIDLMLPGNTPVITIFSCLPFATTSGVTYYSYRYLIAVGILLNSIITYAAEKIIVSKVTRRYDRSKEAKKYAEFDELMDSLQEVRIHSEIKKKEFDTQQELESGYS